MVMTRARATSQKETVSSKNAQEPPIVPLSTSPLTWGVELELVFTFHESQLHLAGIPDSSHDEYVHPTIPAKGLYYHFRRYNRRFKNPIPWVVLPNRVYNSWGLSNKKRPHVGYTPYSRDVEVVLHRIIEEKCPKIAIHVEESKSIEEKTKDLYDEWLLMREYSVCGVGSKNIPTWLPRVESTIDWDSYGLELVSPVFKSDSNQGFEEIARILDVTKGGPSDLTGAFITNQCGFHVHIQAPDDIRVLKELAILVIVYESEIAKLHPRCRRPEHVNARYLIESNRLVFLHLDKSDTSRPTYGDLDVSDAALIRQPATFLQEIREKIEQCSTPQEVAHLMNWPAYGNGNELGNRARQVNFTTAARPDSAPHTIEFRQARGTLDEKGVRMWVEFCIGLVRVAEFYVDNPGAFPMKTFKPYLVGEDGEPVTEKFDIMDLMRDMVLSEEDKDYWRARIATYAARGGPLDRLDNEKDVGDGEEGEGIPGGRESEDDDLGADPAVAPSGGDGHKYSGANNLSGGIKFRSHKSTDKNGGEKKGSCPLEQSHNKSQGTLTRARAKRSREVDDSQQLHKSKRRRTDINNLQLSPMVVGRIGEFLSSVGSFLSGRRTPSPAIPRKSKRLRDRKCNRAPAKILPPQKKSIGSPLCSPIVWAMGAILPTLMSFVPGFSSFVPLDFDAPAEGMEAPIGSMSPDKAHIFNGFGWAVKDFDMDSWERKDTSISITTPTGRRDFVCAINAIIQSMRYQYPRSGPSYTTSVELLALHDNLIGRELDNDGDDTELAELVDLWTDSKYQIVVVDDATDYKFAFRGSSLHDDPGQAKFGRNLYVAHQTHEGGGGHWESMVRREESAESFEREQPVEDGAPIVGDSMEGVEMWKDGEDSSSSDEESQTWLDAIL